MKTLYGCEYCAFASELKGMVSFHEGNCVKNPSVKSCFTCKQHTIVRESGDGTEYRCVVGVSTHTRMDCEDGVVNCDQYQDKR